MDEYSLKLKLQFILIVIVSFQFQCAGVMFMMINSPKASFVYWVSILLFPSPLAQYFREIIIIIIIIEEGRS